MYKPLQKKNSSWTPTTAQKKSKSPSKLGHFSIQPKPNQKSSQSQEIGEYSRDSADRLAANVMRSLETKGSQETETPTVQPKSESGISVADVVGQKMPTLTPHTLSPLQRKLTVGQPGDKYEQEADTVAAKVVEQINSPTSQQSVQGKVEPVVEPTVMRDGGVGGGAVDASIEQGIQQAKGGGQGLSEDVREPMEQAFGADFSGVRVHNNSNADQLNHSLNARAFTTGPDIFFKQGEYNPGSRDGQELLAHELTHVVQQGVGQKQTLQRTLGDGHDLTSPRFSKLLDLEEAYDDETLIKKGSSGRGVQAIQQALYDIGIPLPKFGADGEFGAETDAAVRQFQKGKGLVPDGLVGPKTMAALDARFPPVTLPAKAKLRATWNWSCVKDILCPWSPHTVDVLSSYTVKSFDSIFWDDEKWDGKSWVVDPFPGGGYQSTSDREIGLLNDETCEAVAETLYHEVLHAKQPSTHSTTQEVEGYAYRIGEEFSIGMGLSGFPELRSSDAQGREYADQAKVDEFVAAEYPSVAGGGEEIIGRLGSGPDVEVLRPDGSVYVRPAKIGEKVPGPIRTVNEVTHDTSKWTC
ncbi:MAG: DUF4157 domain-containing protein [Coleofasciculus sp. D1-CHI-01]|uniref:eCIS core domain-containing protein n=1 Tax=Coleofasciculus sp. D1-CHI-01 TaxID=3068482 RepID=UPI00330449E8